MAPSASAPASGPALYPRLTEPRLEEALAGSPVVLIHGPRQCGKTKLAQAIGSRRGYAYFSFDDEVLRAGALADPAGFGGDLPERVVLDAQCELARRPSAFVEALFAGAFKLRRRERLAGGLAERVAAGGYPAALARPSARRRGAWYRDYLEALV